jgi:hypothetical protein
VTTLGPLVPPQPASELADVLAAVRWYLQQTDGNGNLLGTTKPPPIVLLGERYLDENDIPNRVVFVPNPETSKEALAGEGRKLNTKSLWAIAETCDVYVWGDENADDFERYRLATDLRRAVLNAFHRAGPGRVVLLGIDRNHGTNIVTRGEEFVLHLAYVSEVKQTPISVITAPGAPTSPPDPQLPPGVTPLPIKLVPTVQMEAP